MQGRRPGRKRSGSAHDDPFASLERRDDVGSGPRRLTPKHTKCHAANLGRDSLSARPRRTATRLCAPRFCPTTTDQHQPTAAA